MTLLLGCFLLDLALLGSFGALYLSGWRKKRSGVLCVECVLLIWKRHAVILPLTVGLLCRVWGWTREAQTQRTNDRKPTPGTGHLTHTHSACPLGTTLQSGGPENYLPRFRRCQTFFSLGEKSGQPPLPRAHSPDPDPRVCCGFLHWSCSGGNFLSLQLSEASPCPLLVSLLSVAHGLGAPVRGPAISHRLASLLP